MPCARISRLVLLSLLAVAYYATTAAAESISGTISSTKLITEDSELVGNVTCTTTTTPCLQFGAPNVTLRLNGFTITGPGNPDDTTMCNATSGTPTADGISNGTSVASSQAGVRIIGPGMVQRFRRHGIFIVGAPGVSTNATVRHVTSHHNCFSGLLTTGMTNSVMEGNVSVRNAANSGAAPCGGNCLISSNNNRVVENVFGGNGSPCATALCAAAPTIGSNNDFGLGLIGTSSSNLIERNTISGNSNGILIQAGASGNTMRQNIVAGNPPSQFSRTYGPIGFDIKDEAATNVARNTFDRNWCVLYSGPAPSPCPNLPGVVGPTVVAVTATPDVLWPANRHLVPVTVDVIVSDDSDPAPVCQISDVTSNEQLTPADWSISGPLTLMLRSDRNGLGAGRTYSITVTCTNDSQLSTNASVIVSVPHDQR